VLGLLGRTGSGKTTVARLLFRLHDPTAGAIRIGGVELREAALEGLRRRIGVVTQDIQLFHASVRDNVTFFDTSQSDARVEAVLGDARCRDRLARRSAASATTSTRWSGT
jgi:ATP-binding cassette subfamily B protein/ATP-binding cassette subfamily C protein